MIRSTKKLLAFILVTVMLVIGMSSLVAADTITSETILQKMLVVYNMQPSTKDGTTYFPIHIYAAIDSLHYQEVGMSMTVEVLSTGTEATKVFSTKKVYSSMSVTNSSGVVTKYTPDQLGGNHIFGHEMLFTAKNWIGTDTKISVTPYAIDHDGNTINGRTIEITDAAIKQRDPSSALFRQAQTFTPKLEEATVVECGSIATLGELFANAATVDSSTVSVIVSDNVIYTANTSDWTQSTLEFVSNGIATVTVKEGYNLATTFSFEIAQLDKFDKKFQNTDKYLYRVGNANTVTLGSLFKASDVGTIDSSKVTVEIEGIEGIATGTYTANTSDWTKGTIKFAGTGTVNVTVNEGSNVPEVLCLEVVNAVNSTGAASATSNNVVLLNDCTFSTISVKNGYTLYGNGFTMTVPGDITGDNLSLSFVELDNGTLDNVRIICPNFSLAAMYNSQIKVSGNVDPTAEWRYFNIRSAVGSKNNSKIINSYISGGRNAVNLCSGKLLVENTTIFGGSVSNICVGTAQGLVLRDVTLIQKPVQANVNDTSKTLMGFSVVVICDGSSGGSTPITIEGDFVQYAWANEEYEAYVPTGADTILPVILAESDYKHNITLDGVKADWMNLGIAYMPFDIGASVAAPVITDNRTAKDEIPYETVSLMVLSTTAYVYSYKNTLGTHDSFINLAEYESEKFDPTIPTVSFADNTLPEIVKEFDSLNGWEYTLTADLDTIGNYNFDFADLSIEKDGMTFDYTVKTIDGTAVDKSQLIALTDSGVHEYILTVSDNISYDKDGQISSETYACNLHFIIVATKTSIAPPEKVAEPGGTPLLVVKSKNSDWSCALPALEGTQIKYYSVSEKAYKTLALSSLTPTSTGKQNGTSNTWTYTASNNDFTLTITCGIIHDGKSVYGMPVVVNNGGNKMYFVMSSTSGYVGTGTSARTVTISYKFQDNNGGELNFSKTWQFNYADYKSGTQYLYDNFAKGELKEATSLGGLTCLAEGSLITLADGSQKKVEDITSEDDLLVFNHETGKYEAGKLWFTDHADDSSEVRRIINLKFSDGTITRICYEHSFFDLDLMKYVFIREDNVADYIGHRFVKTLYDGESFTNGEVTLVDAFVTVENIKVYGPITEYHFNMVSDSLLSMPSFNFGITGFINIFDYEDDLSYDDEQMAADLAEYGVFTYDDFSDVMTLEDYNKTPMKYFKASIGKGYLTYEEIEMTLVYLAENGFASQN